ncbi:MAG TPA: hypothetical protein DCS93_10510 [Microscillaceae bacterium]|nr:hypothetical protein [Microscillaceae bacterium]
MEKQTQIIDPLQKLLAQFKLKQATILEEMAQMARDAQEGQGLEVQAYKVLDARLKAWKEAIAAVEAALIPAK